MPEKRTPSSEKNGNGSSSTGPVRRSELVASVPEQLQLFPRKEGYRGRHGKAAIVTPVAVVDTWHLEPLEKSFPSKHQHAVRVGDKNCQRW